MNSQVELEEDANTFIQFLNLTGDISEVLYLAKHPEEDDEFLVQCEREGNRPTQITVYPDLYAQHPPELQEFHL